MRLLKHDFLLRQAIRDAAYCLSDSNQTLSDQKLTKGITNSVKEDDGGDQIKRTSVSVQLDSEEQNLIPETLQVPQVPRHLLQTLRLLRRRPSHHPVARPRARQLRSQGVCARHVSHRRPRNLSRCSRRGSPSQLAQRRNR